MYVTVLKKAAILFLFAVSFHIHALNVNVKEYGATGNGTTIDRPAIQAAINAVATAGGGVVYFPAGTYLVDIVQPPPGAFEWSKALTIKPNVKLQGQGTIGANYTAIKLKNAVGNYGTILGGSPLNSNLSGFAMDNIVIDNNSSENPLNSIEDLNKTSSWELHTPRCGVSVQNGSNIKIKNCKFINSQAIWTIFICGQQQVSYVDVINNSFENIGGGNIDFDSSTLYVEGNYSNLIGNTFTSTLGNNPGSLGLRTAIELHQKNHLIKDNAIYGFQAGINIGGSSYDGTENVIVQNNTIENAYNGIILWPNASTTSNDYSLMKVSVFDNNITLNVDGWVNLVGSYSMGVSIAQQGTSDRRVKWLDICKNTISFLNNARRNRPTEVDKYSAGVRYNRMNNTSAYNQTETMHVNNNTILNAVSEGVYIYAPIEDNAEMCSNTITNSGQGNATWPGFRSGMLFAGSTLENTMVATNSFTDNQTVKTMGYGIRAENDVLGYNIISQNTSSGLPYTLFSRGAGSGTWTQNPIRPAIDRFYIYHANGGTTIDPLISGEMMNPAELSDDLALRAVATGTGSVVFKWEKPDGTVAQWTDNTEWYYIYNGDNTFAEGVHKITATPYSDTNAAGQQGTPRSVVFYMFNYVSALADSDNDGMTDIYEDFYGLNKNSSADATTDADNDGYNNSTEYANRSNPLVPESIMYLKLNEALTANYCEDSSPTHSNSGTLNGTGAIRMPGSIRLPGLSTDYISVADNAALRGMTQLTLSAWVNFDTINRNDMIIGKNYCYLLAKNSSGQLYFNYSKTGSSWDGAVTRTVSLTAKQWYHIAVTYSASSGTVIFYVNGVQVGSPATISLPGSVYNSTSVLEVGRLWSAWALLGSVDEVQVHNQVLSSTQIKNMMIPAWW